MRGLSKMGSIAVILLLGAGCGPSLAQLRTRSSLDMSCAPEGLQVQVIDPGTRLVTGCGKHAVYVEQYNYNIHPTWLLNSNVESSSRSEPLARNAQP